MTLIWIFIITTIKQLPVSFDLPILKESLHFGIPLTPRIFFGFLNTQFDKYMISLLATIGGVGIYHIGKQISEKTFLFMTAIQNIYRPKVLKSMFDQDEQTSSKFIGKYITPFLYISIFWIVIWIAKITSNSSYIIIISIIHFIKFPHWNSPL